MMVTIAKFNSVNDAFLAKSKLEGSGIEAFIPDENLASLNWLYTGAMGGVRLEVSEEDKDRAIEILDLTYEDSESILCPSCGSSDVKFRMVNPFVALSIILFGFFFPSKSFKIDCMTCEHVFDYKRPKTNKADYEK